jgi:anti-anti-sigma factor
MPTECLSIELGENVIQLVGELDILSVHAFLASIDLVTHSTVTVDVSRLTFLDARGLSAIITAAIRLREEGDDLEVRGAGGIVRRVFEVTGQANLLSD